MDNGQLEEAFLKFRDRLERLAAQTLPPVLSRRVSPEDVVQETMVAVSRDNSPFMSNPDLPLYFKLRTALLQTIAQIERRNLAAEKRDAYREVEPQPPADDDASQGFGTDHCFATRRDSETASAPPSSASARRPHRSATCAPSSA